MDPRPVGCLPSATSSAEAVVVLLIERPGRGRANDLEAPRRAAWCSSVVPSDSSRSGSRPLPAAAPRLQACGCPARDTAPRRRGYRPPRPSSRDHVHRSPPPSPASAGVRIGAATPTVISPGFLSGSAASDRAGAVPDHHLERFDVGGDGGAENGVVEPVGVGMCVEWNGPEPLVRSASVRYSPDRAPSPCSDDRDDGGSRRTRTDRSSRRASRRRHTAIRR